MFNLNENNRFFISNAPIDMRVGVNAMCGKDRQGGGDPTDGRHHLDNNDVERGQRPAVMGRKNYLCSHDDKGAEDNAVFYSLLESCDVVQLNPLEWLTDILGKLKDNMDEDEIMQHLPYQYKKSRE